MTGEFSPVVLDPLNEYIEKAFCMEGLDGGTGDGDRVAGDEEEVWVVEPDCLTQVARE